MNPENPILRTHAVVRDVQDRQGGPIDFFAALRLVLQQGLAVGPIAGLVAYDTFVRDSPNAEHLGAVFAIVLGQAFALMFLN